MTEHEERQSEAALGDRVGTALEATPGSPESLDAVIRQAAVNVGTDIRARPRARRRPALAASFLLGAVLSGVLFASLPFGRPRESLDLAIEVEVRGAGTASQRIPVESADPQVWFDYIEELIYTGELEDAERHLRRFNELHPDFRPQP